MKQTLVQFVVTNDKLAVITGLIIGEVTNLKTTPMEDVIAARDARHARRPEAPSPVAMTTRPTPAQPPASDLFARKAYSRPKGLERCILAFLAKSRFNIGDKISYAELEGAAIAQGYKACSVSPTVSNIVNAGVLARLSRKHKAVILVKRPVLA